MSRRFPGSFVLILAISAVGVARAQQCTVQAASTFSIRAEGFAELVGDILIMCTGGTPTPAGVAILIQTIAVYVNETSLASRIVATSGIAEWRESLLILDESPPESQFPCTGGTGPQPCAAYGNGTGQPTYYGGGVSTPSAPSNRNVFQGATTGPFTPTLFFFPFDSPGPGSTRTIRITNLRVNANQLGTPLLGQGPVNLYVEMVGNLPVLSGTTTVGIVSAGLKASLRDAASSSPMTSIRWKPEGASSPEAVATLRFEEFSPSAFKRQTSARPTGQTPPPPVSQYTPGVIYPGESGFVNAAFPILPFKGDRGTSGLADSGTRLLARFSSIPPGAQI